MQVKITGLRPGEKLNEELLMDTEQDKMAKTAHNKIFHCAADADRPFLKNTYTDLQTLKTAGGTTITMLLTFCRRWCPPITPTGVWCRPYRCGCHRQHGHLLQEEVNRKAAGGQARCQGGLTYVSAL